MSDKPRWMVPPHVAGLVDRIDGAEFHCYTDSPNPGDLLPWSVFTIPDSAVDRVKRLGGRPYPQLGYPIETV